MREIEFRAWTGSEMEYNIIVGKFGAFYVNAGDKGDGLDPNDAGSLSPFNTIFSDTVPIMQYTGLRDKNGAKIFEGDIVVIKESVARGDGFYDDGISQVIFDDGLQLFRFDGDSNDGIGEWRTNFMVAGDIEIVGNIHEDKKDV